jgi:hypothetical protein
LGRIRFLVFCLKETDMKDRFYALLPFVIVAVVLISCYFVAAEYLSQQTAILLTGGIGIALFSGALVYAVFGIFYPGHLAHRKEFAKLRSSHAPW